MVNYIINGLQNGFNIGFNGVNKCTRPKNLISATKNKSKLNEAITKELIRGHSSGPFDTPPFYNLHCSPIGGVIKKDSSCRLIMDLSQPYGASINENISKEEFSVKYTHFDQATDLVRLAGRSCLMCKVDIKHAFRLMPVRMEDWKLLGYFWEGHYFIDTVLPFGLRSSPGIFNRFADLVCWVLCNKFNINSLVHYSDDYFLVCGDNLSFAIAELNKLLKAFKDLNVPLAQEKIIGPVNVITYLGIEINSNNLTISIPQEKYLELMHILPNWVTRTTVKKQQLLSLIGKLSFICKVVRPGRIFLRRLIDLSTSVNKLHHHITMNKSVREDLKWWMEFLQSWNQTSIIPESFHITSADIKLYTDASGMGYGAIYNNEWIQGRWVGNSSKYSIDFKELFAIVASVLTWGKHWVGKKIIFFTDNLPITQIWDTGTSHSKEVMVLVRKLYLFAAQIGFSVSLKHILGIYNPIADSISRFQVKKFKELAPQAEERPTQVPQSAIELLLNLTIQ